MNAVYCPSCDGDGWVPATWQGSDPEPDPEEPCGVCRGTGKVPAPRHLSTCCMSEPERIEARFYELVERYQREHPDLDEVYAEDWAREMLEANEFARRTI
jgi:hypothetical protein